MLFAGQSCAFWFGDFMKLKSILALILAVVFIFSAAACSKSESHNSTDANNETTAPLTEPDIELITSAREDDEADEVLFSDRGVFNVLLMGIGDINDLGMCDTMMILTIDKEREKLKLTSLLCDTAVNIPNYGEKPLNLAYAYGAISLAVDTVEFNFGIDIHRYALVNFYTFEDIINSAGGVELELDTKEIALINSRMSADGKTDTLSGESGVLTLNGLQAVYLLKSGGDINEEWNRTERQRRLVEAIAKAITNTPASELLELAKKAVPFLNTDITNNEMNLLLKNIKTYMAYDVKSVAVPFDNTWSYQEDTAGDMIVINQWGKVKEEISALIYGE